ncbi:MAG TPA: hypothetical protein PLF42_14200 [Anaerolineales bacterium]|nr:hypothetical protein [Anaerolineales bacterium]
MKKILIISLAFVLAACGAVQPVAQEPPAQEPPTPIVITVVVPGEQPADAQAPTSIPLPTLEPPTEAPPVEAPTEVPQPTAEPASASTGDPNLIPVDVDFMLGKGVFSNIKFSSDKLTLNCFPREMQITMTALMPDVVRAEMFYRIVDSMSRYSDWFLVGNLQPDGQGNFSITFKATDINPNYRVLQTAWIDFQFAGVNRGGGVVDRTQRIERLVTYHKECP